MEDLVHNTFAQTKHTQGNGSKGDRRQDVTQTVASAQRTDMHHRNRKEKVRLAYLVTHPIQYQAPLLRRIACDEDIDLTVFFCSDVSLRGYRDQGFGRTIEWDVPLLDGYRHEFLPTLGSTSLISFWRPVNYGLASRLKRGRFDVLWIHGYARWYHLAAMCFAKLHGMKVLIRDEATMISAQRGRIRKALKRIFFLILDRLCDGFLAIGSLNREYYRKHGVRDEKVFLVPYAVDNSFFQSKAAEATALRDELRATLGLESGRSVILYVSKLTARKRPQDLLEAYMLLSVDGKEPRPYLLFVGDGEMRAELEQRVRQRGWSSIKFLGFRNQTELPRYYDLCDVFVLPSVNEPWGLVVNEVMNAGRAVIASDQVGCAPDLVKDRESGRIFRAGDVAGLCSALKDVLESPECCRALGKKGLEIVNKWGFDDDLVGLKSALSYVARRR